MDDIGEDERGDRERSKCRKYRKELGLLQAKVDFLEEELLAERRLCRRLQDAFLRIKENTVMNGQVPSQVRAVETQTDVQEVDRRQSNGTIHLNGGGSPACSVISTSPKEQTNGLATFQAALSVLASQPPVAAEPAQSTATTEPLKQAQPDIAEKQTGESGCERCCGKLVFDATVSSVPLVAANSCTEGSSSNTDCDLDATEEEMKEFDFTAFVNLRDETLALQNSTMNGLESSETDHVPASAESGVQPESAGNGEVLAARPTFKFPDLPLDVRHQLSRLRKGDLVPTTLRKRIVARLYCALSAGTLYPGRLYSTAAEELVRRFPQLRDASPTGCKTWHEGMRSRAKNMRRKMGPGIPEVDRAKAKVRLRLEATRPLAASASADGGKSSTGRGSAIRCLPQIELGKEEDEDTVGALVGFLKAETEKPSRDMVKIKVAMNRTFFARRYWMTDLSLTVERVTQRYPALRLEEEIRYEFQRLTQKDAAAGLQAFLEHKIDRVFALLMEKPSTREKANEVMKDAGSCLPAQTKSFLATACLCLLPGLVREKSDRFLKKLEPGKQHHHPTIIFAGKDAFNSSIVQVAFEDIVITVVDIKHAISLMICMYWAFNVEYVTEARNTLSILEYVIGVRHTQLGTSALKFVSSL
uniref:Uncharacterized protein n=1 Tax=Ixodes ricinus TaxID=34613 RepID=V5IH28_IXORI